MITKQSGSHNSIKLALAFICLKAGDFESVSRTSLTFNVKKCGVSLIQHALQPGYIHVNKMKTLDTYELILQH